MYLLEVRFLTPPDQKNSKFYCGLSEFPVPRPVYPRPPPPLPLSPPPLSPYPPGSELMSKYSPGLKNKTT